MKRDEMIETMRAVLTDLGMDKERSNERSAMTMLALAHLREGDSWSSATNEMYTTRDIMDWICDELGHDYAANTRESFRRQTLHQFIEGGIVEYNADNPKRPTNSPKNNYRIAPPALKVIRSVGSINYQHELNLFREQVTNWLSYVIERRDMARVPVILPGGNRLTLSAGGQNTLIKAMVEEFCPRFIPGGEVLFIDDTDKALRDKAAPVLKSLNIIIPTHGKAPDLIVWNRDRNWLFLMEACSSHGPIDVTRKREIANLFGDAKCPLVLVSCFPDRATMRKYLADLAWETEAWCADTPDHMIHLDGERFLGPYDL
jgi:type II restriction enzyme